MTLFRQPPVHSPLTARALLAGFRAAWLGGGREARAALDRSLRSAYRPRELYLTDSGTSALRLALDAAFAFNRAPVALPAYCCYDVATAADGAEVPFHLYDIDPETLSPNLDSLRRAFGAGARAVVVAHLYAVPLDLERVQALAAEFEALVIEDAAQGSGCEWQGRPAGALGALGILSFGRGKGVTGGSGGALLVNDPRLLSAAEGAWADVEGPREPRGTLVEFTKLKLQWLLGRPALYWIPASLPFLGLGETRYRPPHAVGGISALAAGVLSRTLELANAEVETRRANAARIRAALVTADLISPPERWIAGWLRFPIVLQRTADAARLRYLSRAGVLPGYPKTLADLEGFGNRRINAADEFPGAQVLAARLITVPTHSLTRGAEVPVI